eukprot:gene18884-6252_t
MWLPQAQTKEFLANIDKPAVRFTRAIASNNATVIVDTHER